jgi:hypothetical protein
MQVRDVTVAGGYRGEAGIAAALEPVEGVDEGEGFDRTI